MEDSEIVALFYERSERAIEALGEKYGPLAKRVARNILRSEPDAEECVNDALLAAWDTIPPQRPEHLGAYICRLTRNRAAARYRANTAQKRNRYYDAALDELAECIPGPEDAASLLDVRELAAAVNAFLDTLDYRDRFLFVRRFWYGDELKDVAAMAHLSRHRASVRLSRVRAKLKQYLKEEGLIS